MVDLLWWTCKIQAVIFLVRIERIDLIGYYHNMESWFLGFNNKELHVTRQNGHIEISGNILHSNCLFYMSVQFPPLQSFNNNLVFHIYQTEVTDIHMG